MHLQKIKNWLFRSDLRSDIRPASVIIGMLILIVIISAAMFGPLLYLELYNPEPSQLVMAIVTAISMASFILLFMAGHLILSGIDLIFDICRLIKEG